jgi:hypothetical protein
MLADQLPVPRLYKGVMVSSTFTNLEQHRAALLKAINSHDLKPVAMENDSAKPGVDVIESSLQMVRDGSAYVGVISRKYGQTPVCPKRNPNKLSITELEFEEAQRLNRPILLFIMGAKHSGCEADFETNASKRKKLNAFRERAKKLKPDALVHRVYATFESLDEFKEKANQSVAELRRFLDSQVKSTIPAEKPRATDLIPVAPALYAEPPYIGSHKFLGRKNQLESLSEWALPADTHPVFLYEAIGGAGKSMLTWEWTTNHALQTRKDWAGRFWYSFYEKGAIMADFCQRALAYVTGRPLEDFRKKKPLELSELLLHELASRPWLFVLDGLERILVAYHRYDAAQVADEKSGTTDPIGDRDPCAAIRPEDDDLLRALAAADPSKILISSRLIPRVFLNQSNQPITGVLHQRLPGLRPADAEALFRACGITGTSERIQNYLKQNCDCHPLVTGVLAGLVINYLPDRGNFDVWEIAPDGGGKLNLAALDLVQRRTHILHAALAAVPENGRQLLSTLSLLSEPVDYQTLSALNPHLPPRPRPVLIPPPPESWPVWNHISLNEKERIKRQYQVALKHRNEYEKSLRQWQESAEYVAAPQELTKTVADLERRGLLQYDAAGKCYNLHPVVRGVASGTLRLEEKRQYGQRIIDHFVEQTHRPFEEAETLDDVRDGLEVLRVFLQMGRYEHAYHFYQGDLAHALKFNLEAEPVVLSLIRPFFPQGWNVPPKGFHERAQSYLANEAGMALSGIGETKNALAAYGIALLTDLRQKDWPNVRTDLANIAHAVLRKSQLAREERYLLYALELAELAGNDEALFVTRLDRFGQLASLGLWDEADKMWKLVQPVDRKWSRHLYRPGYAEREYAKLRFYRGKLREEDLQRAEKQARAGKNRASLRDTLDLRGAWQIEGGDWSHAIDTLQEAVRMAHEVGQTNATAQTQLALAKLHLNQLPNPREEAERLAKARRVASRELAELWLAIGDREQAKKHALDAYKWAWADGEPYVHRYELNKTRALLEELEVDIPKLPPYDPGKAEKLPWEDELIAAIQKLRVKRKPARRKPGKHSRSSK